VSSCLTMSPLQNFEPTFEGDIVTSSNPSYVRAISRWASNSERQARYILFPKNDQAVALAIIFATNNNLPIAVRGGGHSVSGSSSVQDGVVIDLSRFLNGVVIDPVGRLAFVGGGATWATVEETAMQHGLATVAGTVNETGVGGLTLGGGWGFLSGEYGLSLDNLTRATVVTASGSILTASPDSNPDLFWGIRGGGCNFGVVTEFVFALHPQRSTVFGGALVFQPVHLDRLVNTIVQWWHDVKPKEAGSLVIARFPYNPTVRLHPNTEVSSKMKHPHFPSPSLLGHFFSTAQQKKVDRGLNHFTTSVCFTTSDTCDVQS
jgi:FAD/FMN-containing dehydrogenase